MQCILLSRRAHLFNKTRVLSRRFASPSEPKLFDKILVANRGEIACRIIRTCKALGIQTVAVHSDADVFAKHVKLADEAVNIGPPPSKESYLRVDRIIEAVKKTGAQAVHPGYGFLSEKEHFVHELEKNNVVFIGPPSSAIHAMGDKVESKKIAKSAGVNIIPGHLGVVDSVENAIQMANQIGYPVMVKATGGGGGKGMRIAWNDTEVREGYRLSKQEAASSFGDDRLLIERFIDNPRHIEIQVLCDKHGNRLYLNERECSIQRRNQKVIEEAPSPFLTPEVRHAMGEQAVALCKRVGYVSAGTCEFLVDPQRNFYFLEMNTRLQVEHPVTEITTGLDLVEWMIKIAAGWRIPFSQSEVPLIGWAMETRVYAEDPLRGFLPSIGRLVRYKEPLEDQEESEEENLNAKTIPTVRVDSGVYEGSEISIFYDPLISKLITYGENRHDAINNMVKALDSYLIRGVTHNINFLRDTFTHPRFLKGDISTKFIPQEYPNGYQGHKLTDTEADQLLVLAAALHHNRCQRAARIGNLEAPEQGQYVIEFRDKKFPVNVHCEEEKLIHVALSENEEPVIVDLREYSTDDFVIPVKLGDEQVIAQLFKITDLGFDIQFCGSVFHLDVLSPIEADLKSFMIETVASVDVNAIISPMAGTLISVAVKPGDKVVVGQEIAVVEAMKMQNLLRATRDGVVTQVKIQPGKPVQLEETIVELQPLPSSPATK